MHYLDIQFNWYKNGIKNIKPDGLISLRQFINAVMNPKEEMKQAFREIEKAAKEGNKQLKGQLKTDKLFFTTPSVIVNPIRNYESIEKFNPIIVMEYDAIEYAAELRDYIFEKQKSCIFAFLSPSKTGAKFLFLSETPKDIDDYKSLFCGLAYELDKFKGLDMSNLRVTQPLFNSWDENAKFREGAVPSTKRGYKTNSFIPFDGEISYPENVSEEDKQECFNMISHLIERIEDSGHNQVISTAFLSGGLCSFYGIDLWDLLEEKIRENEYLSKGTEGYLKSARTMYNKGQLNPTALRRND
jgi:hypothetical protein